MSRAKRVFFRRSEANHPERANEVSESKGCLWSVYIVEAADGTLYTGVAKGSASRRINEHLRGQGSRYLWGRGPLRLRHHEQWVDQSAACRREAQIKRWTRKKKLALIAHDLALLKRS